MALKNFDVGVSLRRELELIKEARCVWVLRGFTQGEKNLSHTPISICKVVLERLQSWYP